MLTHEYEATVLVNGKPVTEIVHAGRTYIEGRKNSNYELRFHNKTSRRVLIIPSVDGLNVLDGKSCGVQSQGYVVNAWQTLVIPGWRVDGSTAAKFVFKPQGASDSSNDQTYVEAIGADADNQGIIGFMVFPEKVKPIVNHWYYPYYTPSWPYYSTPTFGGSTGAGGGTLRSHNIAPSAAGGMGGGSADGSGGGSTIGASMGNAASSQASINNCVSQPVETLSMYQQTCDSAPIDPSLGTGFGKATEFQTVNTEFERENNNTPSVVLAIYYDTLRGLKRQGVPVETLQKSYKPKQTPNPFPASPHVTQTGCPLPKGWKRV